MKIALIGAFDRNNYGDLLMPIVFEKQFREKVPELSNKVSFTYYTYAKRMMKDVGGRDTESLSKQIINGTKCDILIVVGGETLSADFSWTFLNTRNNVISSFFYRGIHKIFPSVFENISKSIMGGTTSNPWIIRKGLLGSRAVIYNTVGGRSMKNDIATSSALIGADYISVRDKEALRLCNDLGIQSHLYPDSVAVISKYFPTPQLASLADDVAIMESRKGPYFTFQVNKMVGEDEIDEIVRQVERIWEKYKLRCILLPIGNARGHDDLYTLRKIFSRLRTPSSLITNPNIFNIAYIIANTELYVGTSLHGAITSISYGVPHVAFTDRVKKLTDFLETWETTPIISVEPQSLSRVIAKLTAVRVRIAMEPTMRSVIIEAERNLDNINELIRQNYHNVQD